MSRRLTGTTQSTSLVSLGNAYLALGESRRAIEFYEQALTIYGEIGDQHGESATLTT